MSFSQALSGLNSQSQKLGTIGNNIANSQTVGFKGSNVQFSDVFANSKVGLGTRVSAVLQNFSEGNVESTNRNLDLAVAGEGFFRYMDTSGEVVYSRNGQLSMTSDGNLINAQGFQIMGYGLNAAGQVQVGGQPQPLNVSAEELDASATTRVGTTLNLDARKVIGDDLSTVEAVDSTGNPAMIDYHYSNNFTVYDSLGNPRNITVYYEKTAANDWTARMTLDGTTLDDGAGNVTEFSVQFDNNGKLINGAGSVNANGAIAGVSFAANDYLGGEPEDLTFDLNLAGTTQFGNTSTVSSLTQNGYTSGTLVGITINEDGTIMRNYSNEQSRPAGQVALVSFRNPEGLTPAGDNVWRASNESGQELVGAPGSGLLGSIVSGAVETSNVDMARELVSMIVAQRAYQANSQTIKTQDELLQTAINLR
ncbi:flagellar hook protein FlgE [Halomonas sp. MCCC 1A17488]|uniref:Flagellar hook protein FlgE n=1 Tax=Billgrantia sulfidoxydans TaxID=2733484 RepID=A0ABX7W5G6_9GAMM|nr:MULTISPECIES: flagellar hook protein FlgE [Halomonas]MCE8014780.1 flagellar hook protein FlgE [Halomonas sp. MCCC 1A17488]MCG3238113.1 flagellar hook protein FlgE [Halomonas sp. MCCC 1A17488]QPP48116.1 flagellar hook protein FlgE [Halomonas sp. SS10-MC5]QTP55405.1 flagellar hook protein FlgE [Halomonas sulfidoxydans]